MPDLKPDSAHTQALLDQLADGNSQALQLLLARHHGDLLSFIDCRVDARLRGRFGASDVVQGAQMEGVRRMSVFLKRRPMPFHVWIRKTAYERLLNLQRAHRQRARRSVDREVCLPPASASLLARPLLSNE